MIKYYAKQSKLPTPPIKLHDWSNAHTNLTSAAIDLTFYYDRKNLSLWPADSRKLQMSIAIKRYEEALEKLKSADKLPE